MEKYTATAAMSTNEVAEHEEDISVWNRDFAGIGERTTLQVESAELLTPTALRLVLAVALLA